MSQRLRDKKHTPVTQKQVQTSNKQYR